MVGDGRAWDQAPNYIEVLLDVKEGTPVNRNPAVKPE
jgi:hypothetical protein